MHTKTLSLKIFSIKLLSNTFLLFYLVLWKSGVGYYKTFYREQLTILILCGSNEGLLSKKDDFLSLLAWQSFRIS